LEESLIRSSVFWEKGKMVHTFALLSICRRGTKKTDTVLMLC